MNGIKDMHYDYKQKINKIDSFKNRNFQVPEIDWKLNEALNIFIKMVAEPKFNQIAGFETSQRSIDSIRPLIVEELQITPSKTTVVDEVYSAILPVDYMHHLSSVGECKKGTCTAMIRTNIIQHDDKETMFYTSSFEWRELNILFSGNTIRCKSDGSFSIEKVYLTYIKLPKYIHNAADFIGGTYNLPNGIALSGIQECELPVDTLSEIVDIAVLITTGDLLSSYQLKQSKLQITN
jgi:hypothetical protein